MSLDSKLDSEIFIEKNRCELFSNSFENTAFKDSHSMISRNYPKVTVIKIVELAKA